MNAAHCEQSTEHTKPKQSVEIDQTGGGNADGVDVVAEPEQSRRVLRIQWLRDPSSGLVASNW